MLPSLLTPTDPDVRRPPPRIVELTAPTDAAVAGLLQEITRRTSTLLRKRGRLDQDSDDQEPDPQLLLALREVAAS